MWYPDRIKKSTDNKEREKKVQTKKEKLSVEKIKEIKNEFFDKYIKNGELEKYMKGINSAQLSRFYSLLEDKNFNKNDEKNEDIKYIKNFIDDQLNRAKVLGKDSSLGKAELFYSYYKENFLKDENLTNSEKNKIYLTLLKTYFRYKLGVDRFDEKLGIKKGDK